MAKNLDLTDWLSPWFSALPMGVVLRPSVQLTLDSRQIQEGDVFVAVPGHTMDGRRFIPMAVAAKASLIFVHTDQPEEHGRFYDDGETCVLSWCGLACHSKCRARVLLILYSAWVWALPVLFPSTFPCLSPSPCLVPSRSLCPSSCLLLP